MTILTNDLLASFSKDKTIKIWSLNENKVNLKRTLKIKNEVRGLVQLNNGYLAGFFNESKSIKIWDPFSFRTVKKLKHTSHITGLAVLENGLASCSINGTINIWNYITGKLINITRCHIDEIHGLTLISSGSLCSYSFDCSIKIWNIDTGKIIKSLIGHTDYVKDLIELTCGYLASCSWDTTIKIWDYFEGANIWKEQHSFVAHSSAIYCLVPDAINNRLYTAGDDGTVKLWNMTNWSLAYEFNKVGVQTITGLF